MSQTVRLYNLEKPQYDRIFPDDSKQMGLGRSEMKNTYSLMVEDYAKTYGINYRLYKNGHVRLRKVK